MTTGPHRETPGRPPPPEGAHAQGEETCRPSSLGLCGLLGGDWYISTGRGGSQAEYNAFQEDAPGEVCDSMGWRHMDLHPRSAFCLLQMEQCQNTKTLKRAHCDSGSFQDEISPQVSAQLQAAEKEANSSQPLQADDTEDLGRLRVEKWCSRIASHGCKDPRVSLWLKAEYNAFQEGDAPGQICDSNGVKYPSYCTFKSHQCLQKTIYNQEVSRHGCQSNETYRVLNEKEGEEEVQLWRKKFNNLWTTG
ncbi:acrosin-binding protein-like [Phaenicophaeus curvirostris]|uniref:acrosin-binding protein-like n=1 Tax=Phaenicophaeus curvirostris TaxID=33595 RepID=UPI0037F0CB04